MEAARDSIGSELERFAVNTLEYIEKEAQLVFEPLVIPELRTRFQGRHVLVVVRGHDYKEDLRALRPYIGEYHPVLVAVDGGADALLDMKLMPDMIIGDFDSLSQRAWNCGAELVHHVHPDGRAPGREELQEQGLPYLEFVVEGTSEDAAMLLAYECRRRADRRRRHPRHDGRVPRQGPRRHVLDVPHPAATRSRCSSTPRASASSTRAGSVAATSSS